jgi:hypothetical protein
MPTNVPRAESPPQDDKRRPALTFAATRYDVDAYRNITDVSTCR